MTATLINFFGQTRTQVKIYNISKRERAEAMLGNRQLLSNWSMSVQHSTSWEANEQRVHEFPIVCWIKTLITLWATVCLVPLSCTSLIQPSTPYYTFYSRFF